MNGYNRAKGMKKQIEEEGIETTDVISRVVNKSPVL